MVKVLKLASESSSEERATNFSTSDNLRSCFDSSFNFFFMNFCNIRGFAALFSILRNTLSHLNLIFFSRPKYRFHRLLTVTFTLFRPVFSITVCIQKVDVAFVLIILILQNSPPVPFSFLYTSLYSKCRCCTEVRNDIACFRVHILNSSKFSATSLRFDCQSITRVTCAVYRSPNSVM